MKKFYFLIIFCVSVNAWPQLSDLRECAVGLNAQATFNLTVQTPVLISAQPTGNYSVNYYLSLDDAFVPQNAIANTTNFLSTSGHTIYARAQSTTSAFYYLTHFDLIVNQPPQSITTVIDGTNLTVSVFPVGDYEYILDDGAWQESPIFLAIGSGFHSIGVRDLNGCGQVYATLEVLSVADNNFKNLSFGPNPVSGLLQISDSERLENITVTDFSGKRIIQKQNVGKEVEIDFLNLSNGVYFVGIQSGSRNKIIKIIKE